MNPTTVIATDLVTPLGAYLRLRPDDGGGSFLLESVERGRLGRHSFVGYGTRFVDLDEAESCGRPVVGYLAYDYAAQLEPTVELPEDGAGLAESRFVVAEAMVRFDHVTGLADVLCGDEEEISAKLLGPLAPLPTGASEKEHGGGTRRSPGRFEYQKGVERVKRHIRAGDAFQVVLSQRAERPTTASALQLYRALRRVNPSPYLFLLDRKSVV